MPLVSDRDREVATVALRSHYASGRLSLSELNERVQIALTARRRSDLANAFRELPPLWRDRGTQMIRRALFVAKVFTGWALLNMFLLTGFIAVAAVHGLTLLEASLLPLAWFVTTLLAFRIARRRRRRPPLGDDAVHLEDLGVLAVHVHAVHARQIADVLLVRIAAVLLGRVVLERCHLQVDVLLLERDVPLVCEVEVVPRDLVAEDRRALEGAEALLGDRAVILVDVVEARLEDDVGLPLLPKRDEQLKDVLPPLGERPHVEVVDGERAFGNAELARRLTHLLRQRVGREARRQRARRDRERDVADVAAGLDEPRHRPATPELAVVRVRREDERSLPGLDHASIIADRRRVAARAMSPKTSQVVGSSKKSLYAFAWAKIATSTSPAASPRPPASVRSIRRNAESPNAIRSQRNSARPITPPSATTVTGVLCEALCLMCRRVSFEYAFEKPPRPTPSTGCRFAIRRPL